MKDKYIYDPIHGYILITPLMQQIIDTPEFQRLRDLKQLGATYYIFPSATHTRFEHSIGVSHLAGTMAQTLQKNQPELKITNNIVELVRIAGLIHDLGHGPFSHLYDHQVKDPDEPEHEERGCKIFEQMVEKYQLPIDKDEVYTINSMVNPSEKFKYVWLFQIVANKINQIDVDKLDYIQRDCYHIGMKCEGEYSRLLTQVSVKYCDGYQMLVWPNKLQFEIFSLFSTRYRLHKQVYHHHAITSYEYLILQILKEIKDDKPNFLDMTDSIVSCRFHTQLRDKQDKISQRLHPKLIDEMVIIDNISKKKEVESYLNSLPNNPYIFKEIRIGFISGEDDNPLDNIYFSKDNSHNAIKINYKSYSFMVPQTCQERIVRLYLKDGTITKDNLDTWKHIQELYKN